MTPGYLLLSISESKEHTPVESVSGNMKNGPKKKRKRKRKRKKTCGLRITTKGMLLMCSIGSSSELKRGKHLVQLRFRPAPKECPTKTSW
jgi:hypothetical protein